MDTVNAATNRKIGKRLKDARQKLGATQAEIAKKADLSTNYYARIERGDASATVNALQKIARALKVKSSDILPF